MGCQAAKAAVLAMYTMNVRNVVDTTPKLPVVATAASVAQAKPRNAKEEREKHKNKTEGGWGDLRMGVVCGVTPAVTAVAVAVWPPLRGTYFRNSMQMCAARRDVCFDFLAKKDEHGRSQSSTNGRAPHTLYLLLPRAPASPSKEKQATLWSCHWGLCWHGSLWADGRP